MSQSVSNVSSNSALGGLWTGSAAKATGTQTADSAFGTALSTMLGGEASTQEGSLAAQLTLLSLTNSSQNTEDSSAVDLSGLLDELVTQLEQVDEDSSYNEELLDMLQGWLQNAIALLGNDASNQEAGQRANHEALLTLAQQPQTIRFALQDVMMQLGQRSASNQPELANVTPQQATALLEALQAILAKSRLSESKSSAESNRQGGTADFAARLTSQLGVLNQDSQQRSGLGSAQQSTVAAGQKGSMESALSETIQVQPKATEHISSSNQTPAVSSEGESDSWIQSGTIVTAGQLAIRDHSAVLKAPVAQVPVENFSEEVGKFIVNKLEIIKAGGVSEAKISLYPEHLGQVDVKITMQNGQMVAQFVTEHLFAKESLEGQMAQLRSALQSQGLQVNKLEVTQNVGLSAHMYQDGRQQGNSSHLNQQQQGRRQNEVREEDFLSVQDLNEEWTEWIGESRTRDAGLGSSFVARV